MIALQLGRLEARITGSRLVLAGRLDESAALGELADHVLPGEVVVDTSGVSFVNSVGMRAWIRLIRGLRARGVTVVLERVADVLMTQMNMIPELAVSVRITSFHAQYVCPACGAESTPVVDAVAHAAALRALAAPRLPCSECGAAMELGDFPERYLTIFRS
jgi:anti-anti-sigma regulatory factor